MRNERKQRLRLRDLAELVRWTCDDQWIRCRGMRSSATSNYHHPHHRHQTLHNIMATILCIILEQCLRDLYNIFASYPNPYLTPAGSSNTSRTVYPRASLATRQSTPPTASLLPHPLLHLPSHIPIVLALRADCAPPPPSSSAL